MTVTMEITGFEDVMPCRSVDSTLKMEAVNMSETSAMVYHTAWYHILGYSNLKLLLYEDFTNAYLYDVH
jgi:hypothetical protein